MPSFAPAIESPTNEPSVVTIPSISSHAGRSARTTSAPTSVQTGTVARIGAAIDTGRCLTAKYEQTHETATTKDFNNRSPCCVQVSGATVRLDGSAVGASACMVISSSQTDALQTLAKKSTGSTAL